MVAVANADGVQESRYPRRTIFARYCTSYASWSPGSHGLEGAHTLPGPGLGTHQCCCPGGCCRGLTEYKDRLSPELWELMQQGGFQAEKAVVTRLLAEQRERGGATAAPRL